MAQFKKNAHASLEQKSALADFMNENKALSNGKFSSTFSVKDSQKMWEQLTLKLNAMPGAQKDWKHWRKTWHDMKSAVKGKQAMINNERKRTGGGPPPPIDLTCVEEKILSTIPQNSIKGLNSTAESSTEFVFENEQGAFEIIEEHGASVTEDDDLILLNNVSQVSSVTVVGTDAPGPSHLTPTIEMNKNQKRTVAGKRLERSANSTAGLYEVSKQKLEIKKMYYEQKLKLLERQVIALENIAQRLKNN